MENSKLWILNHKDWIKAGVMLVGSSVLGLIINALQNGTHINWGTVGTTALVTFLTYIMKNLSSNESGMPLGTQALAEKLEKK